MHRQITLLVVVTTVLQLILNALEDYTVPRFPHLRTILYGGNALATGTRTRLHALLPHVSLVGAYRMTETASSLTLLNHSDLPPEYRLHASAGWPPAHVSLRIDSTTSGTPGEILTRGPHVMPGYLGGDFHSKGAQEAWLRTEDIGTLEEKTGVLTVHGRSHDVIKSGGESVFEPEVEQCLRANEFVEEAVVVGLPHAVLGNSVVAAVQLDLPVGRIEAGLRVLKQAFLHLASYKRPKCILHEDLLPRSASGKVFKPMAVELLQTRIPAYALL